MGIVEDNNLHGQQYAWLTTCGMFCFFTYYPIFSAHSSSLQSTSPCDYSFSTFAHHLGLRHFASLVWEFPTNRLLQRLPVAKYLAFKSVPLLLLV